MTWNAIIAALYLFASLANAAVYQTRFHGVTWDDANWIIRTTSLTPGRYQSRASLANGYAGINIAALGPFFEVDQSVNGDNINGWPLYDRRQTFATIAGFYDVQPSTDGSNFPWLYQYGGESVISGIPHWSGLPVEYEGHTLNASTDPAEISDFRSELNIRQATLTWHYTWTPSGSSGFDVEFSMFVHKLYINHAAVRLRIASPQAANITVYNVLNGDCALRTTDWEKGQSSFSDLGGIWSAVKPRNLPHVTAFVFSTTLVDGNFDGRSTQLVPQSPFGGYNGSSLVQSFAVNLQAGKTTVIEKSIGIASSDAFQDLDTARSVARKASIDGAKAGYSEMLKSHVKEWDSVMPSDSLDSFRSPENGRLPDDPNIVEQQIYAVNNPFHLLQNTVGENAIIAADNNTKLNVNSIPVCGLTSECYAGQIFWDVEVWMSPGLVVAFPEPARQVANYRLAKYAQAKANVHEAYTSSQELTMFSNNSAIFPWTSGRYGNCTAVGPCFDYEYHINGDIALELENLYYVTGDSESFQSQYFSIYDSVAELYSNLIAYNKTSGLYSLLNATDPDEYANNVDDPAYTMVLIKTVLHGANRFRKQFGLPVNNLWTRQAARLDIPTDNQDDIVLEYEGMNGSISVKQADVVLIDDFLDYENNYTVSDLDYYAGRQSSNGPGMTYGVFSIVASEASPSGCSDYTYDLYSSQPYARAPWFQYSEQLIDDYSSNGGTHPAFPFLTGMGGANRVAVFGYLGLRLRGDSLNVDPTLPPQIPHLVYRTIYWQGHAISAASNHTHTVLTRLPARAIRTANPAYANTSIPVTIGYNPHIHLLPPATPLTFPTRSPGLSKTIPRNLAQCRPATSNQHFNPGQFPLAAVDGAASSTWQPASNTTHSSLTVTLGPAGLTRISALKFDWAQAPPAFYNVALSNVSNPRHDQLRNVTGTRRGRITRPYKAARAGLVEPYAGNTTNLTLAGPVFGGLYAVLTVWGSLAGDGEGATVAEFAVVAEG